MANIFESLSQSFSALFGGSVSGQSVIGIDIGTSSIKIVQLKRKGARAILETYGELSLGPYAKAPVGAATSLPEDKMSEALHDILTEKEVNITTNLCGIAIPFASSLMSVIELPEVSNKELSAMIPLEARKYIPVPISEVALDWSIIPRSESSSPNGLVNKSTAESQKTKTIDVLMVAIHNDTIRRYSELATKNNLNPGFFEIEIFSTMRSVIDQNLTPVMIFDMGAATTKLFIVERGLLKASHTINRGAQNMTAAISKSLGIAEDQAEMMKRTMGLLNTTPEGQSVAKVLQLTLEYIFEEANRILLTFEKKYNKNIAKVIMVGGGSALKGLNEAAKKGFQAEVVSGEPFSKVIAPAFLEEVLRQTGPQFAVAVGLALRRLEEM